MTGRGRVDADILQQDVNGLADAHLDLWRELDGCRILITTGFVGSFILHLITALCRRHGLHIHILALVRSRKRLREVLGDDREGSWLQVVEQDLRAPLSLKNEGPIEYCIHAASNADPVAYQSDSLGTMMTNVVGTEQILQYLAGLGTSPSEWFICPALKPMEVIAGRGSSRRGTGEASTRQLSATAI